jgi:hypothetical protein
MSVRICTSAVSLSLSKGCLLLGLFWNGGRQGFDKLSHTGVSE